MSTESRPARIEPDNTVDHETLSMRFEVPIRATAVCATVRAARFKIAFVYVIFRLPFVCLFVDLAFQPFDLAFQPFDFRFVVLISGTIQICDCAGQRNEHCSSGER